jgi:transposase
MSKRRKAPRGVEGMAVVHAHAAGIDIGVSEIYVAVPSAADPQPVRHFASYTPDLVQLAEWLERCGVTTVAMESTGVYWVPLYELLDARGLEVYLVNSRPLKRAPGRKSDVADCQWLQQLHTVGMLQNSFRPAAEIAALRAVVRQRETQVRYRSMHIQHMQKALHLMNLQLTQVLSDITGVTGLRILRSIVAGERNPKQLAQLRSAQCAKSQSEIEKALTGSYAPEHLFALAQALAAYDFYEAQIAACDAQLEQMYAQLPPPPAVETDDPPPPPKRRQAKPRKNQAHFDLATALYQATGVDLTAIDGLDALSVQTVLSEIGTDMSRWPSVKHFTSWLGLAPKQEKSGGKVLRTYRPKTQQPAATALRLAAQALARSQSALGAFYRRLRAKHGPAKANVATAHKLARIIYSMLKHRRAYFDPGPAHYEQQFRERTLRTLQRKAADLGMALVPSSPAPHPQVS